MLAIDPPTLAAAVGNTPLVDISAALAPDAQHVRMLAKLESMNPTGSIKDRIALAMIDAALADGSLRPGQTILEPTSGNTGISLAAIAAARGFRMRAVMPENATQERVQLLRLLGAEITFSEGEYGSNGAVRVAQQIAAQDPSLFMPMQYENPANPGAHYEGTGREIAQQVGDRLDVFVAGLGTGGTLMGCGRRLRETHPGLAVVAAEPLPGDPVMGLRSLDDGYVPPVLDPSLLDRRILVSNVDSLRGMRTLAAAGLFVGVSAGGIFHVAQRIARELEPGSVVVMVVPDGGWKYLSAGLWEDDPEALGERMEHGQWW